MIRAMNDFAETQNVQKGEEMMSAYEKMMAMAAALEEPQPDRDSPRYGLWWARRSDALDEIDRQIAIAQVEQMKRIADALDKLVGIREFEHARSALLESAEIFGSVG